MHDPCTRAFEIKLPLPYRIPAFGGGKEWKTVLIATVNHIDPQRDGSDDSCGWHMRARHGNKKVLDRIVKRIDSDWDRIYRSDSGTTYFRGYFAPNGEPVFSTQGIVLNLFFMAAFEHFGSRNKAMKFCRDNMFDICLFAENPTDSLHDSITMTFGIERNRDDRIRSMASCVYAWILNADRRWWQKPRWHLFHWDVIQRKVGSLKIPDIKFRVGWQIRVPLIQYLKRGLTDRCCICHRGFRFGESVMGCWDGDRIWHDRCDSTTVTSASTLTPKA